MPSACWLLRQWANSIADFKWRLLHFQFGGAFWKVVLREAYFEGPNRVWRALKTSILSTGRERRGHRPAWALLTPPPPPNPNIGSPSGTESPNLRQPPQDDKRPLKLTVSALPARRYGHPPGLPLPLKKIPASTLKHVPTTKHLNQGAVEVWAALPHGKRKGEKERRRADFSKLLQSSNFLFSLLECRVSTTWWPNLLCCKFAQCTVF